MPTIRRIPVCIVLLLLALASLAHAQPRGPEHATVTATVTPAAVAPGGEAVMEVTVTIKPGFHAQSATPSAKNYIAFRITPTAHPHASFGQITYPAGHDETYSALGKLNVYTGTIVTRIPVQIASDAPAGELKLAGRVRYQICDDTTCFMPQNRPFEVTLNIAGSGAAATTGPSTGPTTLPATPPPGDPLTPPAVAPTTVGPRWGLLAAFTTAIVAGLLFNVMPCVLPVVPLKAIGFYEVSQHNRTRSILFGLTFSLGLVASFAVLGLLVVVLQVLDWGELFTIAWFRLMIIAILLAMAVGTFGVFTVNLPTAVYRFSPRHDTYVGNFLFGILTALLSTPCTFGLFVGLLAFAATQPAYVGLPLVMCVGIGMALPYLILSGFPGIARRFPRTGPWAELVKQLMAFLLLATAIFFAKPFIETALTTDAFWWLMFAVVAAAALFLIVRTMTFARSLAPRLVAVTIALAMVLPAAWGARKLTHHPHDWLPYSDQALADARTAEKLVFVEFTADWCGNCHWLEATVINDPSIADLLRRHGAVMLKADLTRDDAPALPLLGQLSAVGGIPLSALYPPGADDPIILTGIYSRSELRDAIALATGPTPAALSSR
jgi:thiol:disulfide interchange protein